ncbi:VanZ like family, partial [Dysosmobacter welbionis]
MTGLHLPQSHHVPQDQGAGPHHLSIRGLRRRLSEADHQLGGEGVLQGLCGNWCHASPYSAGSCFPAVPFLGLVSFLAGVLLPLLAAVFLAAGFLAAVRFLAAGFFSGAAGAASSAAGSADDCAASA